MSALTFNEVHLDTPLTNLTTAYVQSQDVYIADRVFPVVNVSKQSDKYYVWDRDFVNRTGDVKKIAAGTEVEKISMSLSSDSYYVEIYGLGMDFDERTLGNEDAQLNVRAMGARTLINRMLLKREIDWVNSYFASGIWNTEYTGVASPASASQVTYWDDYTNSTPIQDIRKAKTAMYLASGGTSSWNDLVFVVTRDVYDILENHPDILARMNGGATATNPALVNKTRMAEILGVSEILVMDAIQNTAAEGQALSESFVASKKAAIYSRPAQPGLMVPASGYNFVWTGLDGVDYGIAVNTYSGEHLAQKHIAESIEVLMGYDMKVISKDMGVFFNTIVS